ncbi:MAG: hypothetical protein HRU76_11920 [Phycisphaeraceae bacterium]|nr:MAG: hypothetical protein HRU76_11920 [Phycisphaeraceae bacterium]
MAQSHAPIDFEEILRSAGPYPMEAVNFVREGLNFTVHLIHGDPKTMPDADRHVTGQQLCIGLREFAIAQYGMMAPAVLGHWHIHRTDDFGRIVFAMIDAGVMSKTPSDTIDDFRGVYDFDEAFSTSELSRRVGAGRADRS